MSFWIWDLNHWISRYLLTIYHRMLVTILFGNAIGFSIHQQILNQTGWAWRFNRLFAYNRLESIWWNCIFSTLLFIIDQAKKLNVVTPSVTFESYWYNWRLGGLHTLMSFMGSIGWLMKGSGLEELLAEVYADHSVTHMLSGKAISRALLNIIIVPI